MNNMIQPMDGVMHSFYEDMAWKFEWSVVLSDFTGRLIHSHPSTTSLNCPLSPSPPHSPNASSYQ
jgi:hypothetical protein